MLGFDKGYRTTYSDRTFPSLSRQQSWAENGLSYFDNRVGSTMSMANVKRVLEAIAEDETLRQKLAGRGPAEAARIAVQAGSERGLGFTAEELLQVVGGASGPGSGEVGDKELEAVAG